ncbi:hypothetical protein PRIPAC_71773, partial [Pristionchus pacificus]|uniref:Uncharacterized protein n=1 Tax=Pristionchus pacificus TaxID=54126 RepID=A0A2A6CF67_PRIPA
FQLMTVLIHLRSNQGLFLFEALPGDPLLVTLLQSDAWTHISCVELMPTMTDTPITLHNLHADIVKRIIHGAESLDNLQVISRSWNAQVSEYLSAPRLGSLERVQFSACDRLQMVAILPERYSARIGVGRWLSVHQKHTGVDALEVSCAPQESQEVNPTEPSSPPPEDLGLHCYLLAAMVNLLLFVATHPVIGYYALGVASVLTSICICSKGGEGKPEDAQTRRWAIERQASLAKRRRDELQPRDERGQRHFPQIGRFLRMFDRIETLRLDDFKNVIRAAHTSDKLLDTVRTTVHTLPSIDWKSTIHTAHAIQLVEMCRAHRIRHLFIQAYQFDLANFADFVQQFIQLGVALDLYEKGSSQTLVYMGKPRLFWERQEQDLAKHEVSLRVATLHDPSFARGAYGYFVRSHVRCEAIASLVPGQQLAPVETKRGYSRSQSLVYMGKTLLFWERMENELAKQEISLQIATLHDPIFPRAAYGFYVRCHVRCKASDGMTPGQAPTPVETKRGYSISTY